MTLREKIYWSMPRAFWHYEVESTLEGIPLYAWRWPLSIDWLRAWWFK